MSFPSFQINDLKKLKKYFDMEQYETVIDKTKKILQKHQELIVPCYKLICSCIIKLQNDDTEEQLQNILKQDCLRQYQDKFQFEIAYTQFISEKPNYKILKQFLHSNVNTVAARTLKMQIQYKIGNFNGAKQYFSSNFQSPSSISNKLAIMSKLQTFDNNCKYIQSETFEQGYNQTLVLINKNQLQKAREELIHTFNLYNKQDEDDKVESDRLNLEFLDQYLNNKTSTENALLQKLQDVKFGYTDYNNVIGLDKQMQYLQQVLPEETYQQKLVKLYLQPKNKKLQQYCVKHANYQNMLYVKLFQAQQYINPKYTGGKKLKGDKQQTFFDRQQLGSQHSILQVEQVEQSQESQALYQTFGLSGYANLFAGQKGYQNIINWNIAQQQIQQLQNNSKHFQIKYQEEQKQVKPLPIRWQKKARNIKKKQHQGTLVSQQQTANIIRKQNKK